MAHLTQAEFQRAVEILSESLGLQRLRDKFVRLNGLVTRRKTPSADALANQLYMLSSGLRREVPSTFAFQAIWSEHLGANVDREAEEHLESLAEAINACLEDDAGISEGKEAELDAALRAYADALGKAVGEEPAKLDMLMKAVPVVAEKLRAGLPETAAPEPTPVTGEEQPDATDDSDQPPSTPDNGEES